MTRPCAAPLPPDGKPTFAVPAFAYDCHTHLLGPYDRHPPQDERGYSAPEARAEALISLLDSLGLWRAVVVTPTAYGTNNAVLLEALTNYPDRFRGVAVLGPDATDKEIDRLHDAGTRGIRLNLWKRNGERVWPNGVGMESFDALAPRLAERGWHIQIWINVVDLPEILPRLRSVPIDIVVDHMGRIEADKTPADPNFSLLCSLMRDDRFWAKLCGSDRLSLKGAPYTDVDQFARALIAANPDRVVWGSDWPHVGYFDHRMPRDTELLNVVSRWTNDQVIIRKLLADNPARLYGSAP
jgi:2-pyrone-4,6-dicarboxylate lactonase